MKKFSLIAALILIAGLVMSCASSVGGGGVANDSPKGDPNIVEIKLDQDYIFNGKSLPDNERAEGKGWITGENFKLVMNAANGSKIRITCEGTAHLDWDTIGAVSIKDMGTQVKRVDFRPKSGGTYSVDVDIKQVLNKIKGEDEAIGVNIWGEHKIVKVELVLY